MSSSNCCFLTCIQASQEAGHVVWYSHLFQNFPQFIVIHTVEGFGIVNKADIDVFLELSCFFDDPADVGNLISGSSAFSKTSLNIWMFSFHVLLKPGLENWSHYFMANRWGNSGNSDRFIFLGSKITADDDCSHGIKRCLLLGRKAMINPDSVLKNRDITLPTKVCLLKAMVFTLVVYGCESWTRKKADY